MKIVIVVVIVIVIVIVVVIIVVPFFILETFRASAGWILSKNKV